MNISQKDKIRFESKIELIPFTTCWIWSGNCTKKGYGHFSYKGRELSTHRLSYRIYNGPVGKKHVLHSCDNPSCVNPEHLFLGTNVDNVADKVSKGRQAKGSRCYSNIKLTPEQVVEIKAKYKKRVYSCAKIAKEYNVHQSTVWLIVNNKIDLWSNL